MHYSNENIKIQQLHYKVSSFMRLQSARSLKIANSRMLLKSFMHQIIISKFKTSYWHNYFFCEHPVQVLICALAKLQGCTNLHPYLQRDWHCNMEETWRPSKAWINCTQYKYLFINISLLKKVQYKVQISSKLFQVEIKRFQNSQWMIPKALYIQLACLIICLQST